MEEIIFNDEIIGELLSGLYTIRPVFCSEADFQFEFANKIRKHFKVDDDEKQKRVKIYLEYYYDGKYIDILVIIDNKWYPIELKYKTKGNYNSKKNGYLTYKNNGVDFVLKNHLAYTDNYELYSKDIKRIESIKKEIKQKFGKGYAIMLTNDSAYWNKDSKWNITNIGGHNKIELVNYSNLSVGDMCNYDPKRMKKLPLEFKYIVTEIK